MNLSPENPIKYSCELCDYNTCNKKDFKKHLLTVKHSIRVNDSKMISNIPKNPQNLLKICECGKTYKYDSGYYRHRKSCSIINEIIKNEENEKNMQTSNLNDKDLIMLLIKENSELKNMMMEVIKTGTHNTTNNNCHNKTFNLQVFLNETCKDAMNIMDFVDSIKLQLSDLESVGELGYVKGLTNIIVKNLRALDVTKRPVHCSDAKREILYVKDNDVWEKEDGENTKMKKAVKYIAYKNTKLLPLWKQTYPECMQFDSSKNDKYNYMVIEAMGGMGENESEKINKIIKQIAKEVVIEK